MTTSTSAEADVQFFPQAGKIHLTEIIDLTGAPLAVLDASLPFTLKGDVELPAWMTGLGRVRLFADEIGGSLDKRLASVEVKIDGAACPPRTKKYPWKIVVPPQTLPDPSPASGVYHMALTFTFESPAGASTGIGAFLDLGTYFAL